MIVKKLQFGRNSKKNMAFRDIEREKP